MAPILEIKGITKKFGNLVALDNVDLDVDEEEILGLIGPNGAGKTTLFNVITGHYKPNSGKVVFEGKDVTGWPPHEIARMGIVKTHQIVRPFSDLTVLENVTVAALFGRERMSTRDARRKALEAIEFVGLSQKDDELASMLNVHEKKMLELARALAASPKIVLLDEVLAGLNPAEVANALDIVRRLRDERRITIIIVEHVMHAVMNIAERIAVLHYGRKIAEGKPEEVANDHEVITAYLGDPELALKFVRRER